MYISTYIHQYKDIYYILVHIYTNTNMYPNINILQYKHIY